MQQFNGAQGFARAMYQELNTLEAAGRSADFGLFHALLDHCDEAPARGDERQEWLEN